MALAANGTKSTAPKLAVCGLGDPLAPSTWSGTPANICRSLSDISRLSVTVDSAACGHPKVKQLAHVLSKYYYGSSYDTGRGRFHRYLRARHVNRAFRVAGSKDVLHLGTLDLPIVGKDSLIRHYLFCDSTWDLWSRGASNMNVYSTRLIADAERLEQTAYRQMRHIFPISAYVRENLISHYGIKPERISVVGTGRGAIKPYAGPKQYENGTILFVAKGRFEDKGGPLLIDGFKRALQVNPKLQLIIVGDERNRQTIGNLPNVEVHGFVPLDVLQQLFQKASLFAMPAVNEPWGLAYLEALSCKTAVLGLKRNAMPEITQNGRFGFCVGEATPQGITAAILDAFSDQERLARMGTQGQEYCLRTFTWEQTVQRILDVVDQYETADSATTKQLH